MKFFVMSFLSVKFVFHCIAVYLYAKVMVVFVLFVQKAL